ncbi:MAG: transposase family protein [Actinomycetota bacterium]|nr:transposase family protein [Actinomycetota bacterium]
MSVPHAPATAVTSTDEQASGEVPGLLEVLAQVPDPRRSRGRRYLLVFVLAVAAACVLAGAKNFREIGDQAADLPQEVLARLGGKPRPLLRRIIAPSEKRIRTLVHAIGAETLDQIIEGWLRALASAGRLDGLLTVIAIDGKWLRGVADGQVKLFAAMLRDEKVIIAQHRIPAQTTETTQVKSCWSPWTWPARWSPPTRPTRSGRLRSTSPGLNRTAAGNRAADQRPDHRVRPCLRRHHRADNHHH